MKERDFIFVVTEDCQLRCKYCYLVGKGLQGHMSTDIAYRAIDYFLSEKRLRDADKVVFDFIGGEPLLEIDLISNITEYAIEQMKTLNLPWIENFGIRITTNGLLYNTSRVQDFLKRFSDYISISISVDGTKKKHNDNRVYVNGRGSYDDISKNIDLWLKQFPDANTKMVVIPSDASELFDSLVHLVELGIRSIDFNLALEYYWDTAHSKVLEQQLVAFADYVIKKRKWKDIRLSCYDDSIGEPVDIDMFSTPCGLIPCAVDGYGDIYSCMRFKGYSLRAMKPRSVGNIFQGIDWNKLRPLQVMDTQTIYPIECLNCEIGNMCKWCPAENYDSSGSVFVKTTRTCNAYKAIVRAKNYYYRIINQISYNGIY